MLHGIQEFLERAAQIRPQVLLYEDLHWADESTLLLLEHLAGTLAERDPGHRHVPDDRPGAASAVRPLARAPRRACAT